MSNNRFSALLEQTSCFPNRKREYSNQSHRLNHIRHRMDNYKNKSSKVDYLSRPKELFCDADFPEMLSSYSKDNQQKSSQVMTMNFLNKAQVTEIEDIQPNLNEQLSDDWIKLGRNLEENRRNLKAKQEEDEAIINQNQNFITQLNELYIKWFDNYILNWGYEEYESNYCFPNYDYDYFDKLDLELEYESKSSSDDESIEHCD